jgi:hypothetical protein
MLTADIIAANAVAALLYGSPIDGRDDCLAPLILRRHGFVSPYRRYAALLI